MVGRIRDWMVGRAIPHDVEDPAQERIAAEAAENAIRQVVMVFGITSLLVFAALAAALYAFLPSRQFVHEPARSPEVASRGERDYAKLLLAKEESEAKLQQVVMERDALQGKVADLERQLAEQAKHRPPAAEAAPGERERLQGKINDLERQIADLAQKHQVAGAAAAERSAHLPKAARPRSTPAPSEPRITFRCGDGRTVRDPATCTATAPAPPEADPSVPDTYYCGDGRSVPDPAVCGAAVVPPPRR